MGKLLATRLRSRRKELKLSQVELAAGICEQAQISKIERDPDYSPGVDLVHALAKKLGVSMDYFFDESIRVESDFLGQFRVVSKKFLYERDYESLKYIYELEAEKTVKLPLSDQLYLDWIGAIVLFHHDHKEEAIKKIETILTTYNEYDWEYLNISNTLLHFYFQTDHRSKFEDVYQRMASLFEHMIPQTIDELEILVKCRYNFCHYLYVNQQIELAMKEVFITIDMCLENNTFYFLGNLYCLLGNVSEGFADTDKVKEYFVTARNIYQLEKNEKLSLELEHFINETFSSTE